MAAPTQADVRQALARIAKTLKIQRAARAAARVETPPTLVTTLARYREAGLLQPSRKGARPQ